MHKRGINKTRNFAHFNENICFFAIMQLLFYFNNQLPF